MQIKCNQKYSQNIIHFLDNKNILKLLIDDKKIDFNTKR